VTNIYAITAVDSYCTDRQTDTQTESDCSRINHSVAGNNNDGASWLFTFSD